MRSLPRQLPISPPATGQTRRRHSALRRLLLAAGLAAIALAAGVAFRIEIVAILVSARLRTLDDSQTETFLRQVAALGDAPLAAVVDQATSERSAVAAGVASVLDMELAAWSTDDRAVNFRLALAADRLRRSAGALSAPAHAAAERFAVELLRRAAQSNVQQAPELLANGQALMQTLDAIEPAPVNAPLHDAPLPMAASAKGGTPRNVKSVADIEDVRTDLVPGGGLPAEPAAGPPLTPPVEVANSASEPPRRFAAYATAMPITAHEGPDRADSVPDIVVAKTDVSAGLHRVAGRRDDEQRATGVDDPFIRLVVQLHADDASQARALQELERLGFSEREVELGRRLTHADPAERRRWAEALPGLRGAPVKTWLVRLCADSDPGVRRTALSIIATTNDPVLLDLLRRAARQDSDPGVRALAERVLAGVDAAQ